MSDSTEVSTRDALLRAHHQARHTLGRESLGPRVSQSQFAEACADALAALSVPQACPPSWADSLRAALTSDDAQRDFVIRLNGLLHADRPLEQRFEGFAAVLAHRGILDWPTVSVFPALVFPDRFALIAPSLWCSPDVPDVPDRPDWTSYRASQQAAHAAARSLAGSAGLLEVHLAWYSAAPSIPSVSKPT